MSGPAADRGPLWEFDPDPTAVVRPRALRSPEPLPTRAVLCFFPEVLDRLVQDGRAVTVARFSRELGGTPVHVTTDRVDPVAVLHPGVGAPLAAIHLEQLIASRVRSVVACGGAGAVVPLPLGDVVVATAAVRDEGTSHHYLPAAREIALDEDGAAALRAVLVERAVPHRSGRVWTTDAPFRETSGKVAARRSEGCVVVDMECAALAAVAAFRGVRFAQYLYAGDDVSGDEHDHRNWARAGVRATLLDLALEAVARL